MQRWIRFGFLVLLAGVMGTSRPAPAQGRLSDKDLQRLMQNLKDDAQPFRQTFANALKKSTIRKTSREKDARALTDTFAKEASQALETFKHDQKADQQVKALVHTAAQIDPLVYSLQLDSLTTSQWERLRSELHQIAQAFGVPEPYFSALRPTQADEKRLLLVLLSVPNRIVIPTCGTGLSPPKHVLQPVLRVPATEMRTA